MKRLRILGFAMFAYGAVMLALLFTPWKEWAANHSIASLVSATDRRVGNSINGAVDMPISLAGDCVMLFAGLWIGRLRAATAAPEKPENGASPGKAVPGSGRATVA